MRRARQLVKNGKYHVIARANRGEFILESKEVKELLLKTIRRAKKKYSFQIENFCVMDNHVHMIVQPGKKESLSRIMQWILSVFAMNFNHVFKLKGHVWYDRFRSVVINNFRQWVDTFRYICNNPVKAEMVKNAAEYIYGGLAHILMGDFSIVERPPAFFWHWWDC